MPDIPPPARQVRVAIGLADLRACFALVYRTYAQAGYLPFDTVHDGFWYGLHELLPASATLMSQGSGGALTASVIADSPLGLPCEAVFPDEVASLRQRWPRLSECISLAHELDPRAGTGPILELLRGVHLCSRFVQDSSGLLITVNPRHVSFYQRFLGFERLGPERAYGKVGGAPAVLLLLDFATMDETYRQRFAQRGPGNQHEFFITSPMIPELVRGLRAGQQARDPMALLALANRREDRLRELPRHQRMWLGQTLATAVAA